MPITLVTGLPGHGKTLWTLDKFRRETRPVFHNGITGLQLPWQEWDVQKWDELEAGSMLVIDEAQRIFPVRGKGQPPAWIEKLAVHRHLGLDLVLITQNPMLIDSFVRRLCDRHFHVVRKFGTHSATVHEFPNGVKESVATSREGSIRHEWRYPKDVFELYRSSELHTVKRRVPWRVYALFAVPVVLLGLVGLAYYRLNPDTRYSGDQAQPPGGAASANSRGAPAPQPLPVSAPLDWVQAQQPRVPGLAHTAPVYDAVTAPTRAPYPAACISMAERCVCYTTQATKLDVPAELCRNIVAGGWFVSWGQDQPPPQAATASPVPTAEPVRLPVSLPIPAPAGPAAAKR